MRHEDVWNSGVVGDNDFMHHQVERTGPAGSLPPPGLTIDSSLDHDGSRWIVVDGDDVLADFDESEVRLSLSWKAKVYRDEAERQDVAAGIGGIGLDEVLARQCNFDAVGLVLSLARRAGASRFVHASTSSVYGVQEAEDIVERLEPAPIGPYARYKALSEWLVASASAPDFCTVNLRSATVCGWSPRQRFDLTVNKLTIDALTRGVITVHGGEQRRPNVHIDDLVRCYQTLLEADPSVVSGRTYNLSQVNLTVGAIAELIADELSDLRVRIEIAPIHDVRDYHLCADRLERELGFVASTPISEAVRTLRRHALELGTFGDPDDDRYYNLRSMRLDRRDTAYRFIGGES